LYEGDVINHQHSDIPFLMKSPE